MGSGMKLRPKEKNVDSFIDQLKSEGERELYLAHQLRQVIRGFSNEEALL